MYVILYSYLSWRDLDPAEALDDNVVSVVADDDHGHDGHRAERRAQGSIDLAS